MTEGELDVLTQRLGRYPADRYPVQHATAQFHIGSVLLHTGHAEPAAGALRRARDLFAATGMRLERAKATVMLGIALRSLGQPGQAATAFAEAATALAELDRPADHAAAHYNLGLARQDLGDPAGARAAWSAAFDLFRSAGHPARAAAAARDHGASLLAEGEPAAALPLLDAAVRLAEQAGDEAGVGAAANTLGLVRLAVGDLPGAVAALRRAQAAFPRTVRAAEHAMVQANLALAYEHLGDPPRARRAARQALGVADAAAAVCAQAESVLSRLAGGEPAADLLAVLDAEEPAGYVGILRDEVARLLDGPAAERHRLVGDFLTGLLRRPGRALDLAEALLHVVIELPPPSYEAMVESVVRAGAGRADGEADRLRAVLDSALARFALPQWQRLVGALDAAAVAAGEPGWR